MRATAEAVRWRRPPGAQREAVSWRQPAGARRRHRPSMVKGLICLMLDELLEPSSFGLSTTRGGRYYREQLMSIVVDALVIWFFGMKRVGQ